MMNRVMTIPAAIAEAFVEAWGTLMCALFLPGAKLGIWRLRTVKERKSWPQLTRRVEDFIRTAAIVMLCVMLAAAIGVLIWIEVTYGHE